MKIRTQTWSFIIGALVLLLISVLHLFTSAQLSSIKSLDARFENAFYTLTRGTPALVDGRDEAGKLIQKTNFHHTLHLQEGFLRNKLYHDLLAFLWKGGVKAFGPPQSCTAVTETDSLLLWVGFSSSNTLSLSQNYFLKSEQGHEVGLTPQISFDHTNQQHLLTWSIPPLLSNGGKFVLVDKSSGDKLFSITIPKRNVRRSNPAN